MENKLHYVWLSDERYPDKVIRCMDSWTATHPEMDLVKWDLTKFDMSKAPKYVQDAYADKAWSFCTDYIRAYAVYTEGGWYADSDVMIFAKDFMYEPKARFLAGIEDYVWNNPYGGKNNQTYWSRIDKEGNNISGGYIAGVLMNPVFFYGEKGHPYLKAVLDYYDKLDYNGPVDDGCLFSRPIAPQIFTKVLEDYGWKYRNGDQSLDEGIEIVDNNLTRNYGEQPKAGPVYSMHMCSWGWLQNGKAVVR